MFQYEKALQYPVKIKRPNARLAKLICTQLGGRNAKKIYKTLRVQSTAHRFVTRWKEPR